MLKITENSLKNDCFLTVLANFQPFLAFLQYQKVNQKIIKNSRDTVKVVYSSKDVIFGPIFSNIYRKNGSVFNKMALK